MLSHFFLQEITHNFVNNHSTFLCIRDKKNGDLSAQELVVLGSSSTKHGKWRSAQKKTDFGTRDVI